MNGTNGQTITICGNVFRLVETIGRGSYGTVHKAINLSSGAAVAIKLIGKDKIRRPHERRSIEKEIETMRVAVEQYENGHPHIVRLLCTKESQHHIFIVLEYCAGGDIAAYIKLNRGLKEEQARIYMSQLASGLQFLRSQKIVHRDLKPANLLLSSKNISNAKLKIADFGFARELQQESLAESVVGSPLYMAPELLEYKSYDAKADLWSVGIILYEMLVNDHPFLVVENSHATNHFALRKNIYRYFQLYGHIKLPPSITVSQECLELLDGLLRVNPQERISFEDFFQASFVLPPVPTEATGSTSATSSWAGDLESSDSSNKQALVHEQTPSELYDSDDEYVLVDMEYEDVGRKVLEQKDAPTVSATSALPSTVTTPSAAPPTPINTSRLTPKAVPVESSVGTTPAGRKKSASPTASSGGSALRLEKRQEIVTEAEAKVDEEIVAISSTPTISSQEPMPSEERREWAYDDTNLEELLGICYKSFDCGSVALFVPTPLGDYIAFHEGCPHYYLSMESLEAAKVDGKNPPYVLGCIVFIEDYETSAISNPFNLRDGTSYHVVTVTALSTGSNRPKSENGSDTQLPMSQVLASRSPCNEHGATASTSGPTSSFVRTDVIASAPQGTVSTQHQRISFRSFHISHLALFFLKSGKLPYVAFNEGAPNYYLSNESIAAAKGDGKNLPAYICGEIIFIDTFQATEDFNPYKLSYGTRFHVVTIVNPKRT